MLQWIKSAIINWATKDDRQGLELPMNTLDSSNAVRRRNVGLATAKVRTSSDSDDIQTDEVFTFKVWAAGGGKIIEFRSWDRKNDRSNNRLHIINEDEDFAAELGRIVLFELMRS